MTFRTTLGKALQRAHSTMLHGNVIDHFDTKRNRVSALTANGTYDLGAADREIAIDGNGVATIPDVVCNTLADEGPQEFSMRFQMIRPLCAEDMGAAR